MGDIRNDKLIRIGTDVSENAIYRQRIKSSGHRSQLLSHMGSYGLPWRWHRAARLMSMTCCNQSIFHLSVSVEVLETCENHFAVQIVCDERLCYLPLWYNLSIVLLSVTYCIQEAKAYACTGSST